MQDSRPRFRAFVQSQFRQHAMSFRDHNAIEYFLRRGRRQLEAYQNGSIQDVSNTDGSRKEGRK